MSASVAVTRVPATDCVVSSTSVDVERSTSVVIICSDYKCNIKINIETAHLLAHYEPDHVSQFSGKQFSQGWPVFVVIAAACRVVVSGTVTLLAFHISAHQGSPSYCTVYPSFQ